MIEPIVVKIVNLKHEAMQKGLFKTFHALDKVSQIIGWEIAELEKDGKWKWGKGRRIKQ